MQATAARVGGIDWVERWRALVVAREKASSHGHSDPHYWDHRAPTFARSTTSRADQFLDVIEPFVSPRKTLIDAGAGAGRHAVPLAAKLEWVTAVEPSEGMRAHLPALPNLTVIASAWEDAEVAPADLVICCHVLYGVADVVPFIEKLDRSARERVFIMLREGPVPHAANVLRDRSAPSPLPPIPQFSDLFMLLVQMGIAADVSFVRYPVANRYRTLDEAVADCRPLFGDGWEEPRMRRLLEEMLVREGDELVYDGGITVSGIAHWHPRTT
ncbi:MAG TPA: methyltransferase domain-containing protein [Candidatus Dormibacteraeota bacterium]|nr:methyltransferase domain-containing protein [Candidatus Dormibacteraeota bacterium]